MNVSGPEILALRSVLELADTLIEKVALVFSPVMMALVVLSTTVFEPLCVPPCSW